MAVKEKIVITADDKTARAFRSVQSSAKKTADDLAAMSLKMAGIATVGVAAAAGLFLLTKRAIESADAIGKTADKVGLGVESLQELRFGAELAGVATQTLDMAMQRFSRRLGEAADDGGELIKTLKKYKIETEDSEGNTRKVVDVLDDYADAIANAGSAQERLLLSFKGFDSEGAALVNLFRKGSIGLKEMREEAQRLGIVLDEETVRGAEAASDALLRMEKIVSVNLQRVLLQFAPQITALGEAFANAAPQIAEFADKIIGVIFGLEAMSLAGLRRELDETIVSMDAYNATRKAVKELTKAEFEQHLIKTNNFREEINNLSELIKKGEEREEQLRKQFGGDGAADDTGDAAATKAAENERKRAEALLLAIEETNMQIMGHEAELIDMRAEAELAKLAELHEKKLISEMEFLEATGAVMMTALMRKQELEAETEAAITANQKAEFDKREKAAEDLARAELRARRGLHDGLSAIAALQNVQSRKMFEIGKAAAASLALVKTYEGAQGVFASAAQVPYVGWILAPIAAAAAVVTGLANVQAILSTSFGSASGGRGGGGGVGLPSVPAPDVPALAPPANDQGPTRVLDVTLVGSAFTAESIRDELFPLMNEALGDGVQLNVTVTV